MKPAAAASLALAAAAIAAAVAFRPGPRATAVEVPLAPDAGFQAKDVQGALTELSHQLRALEERHGAVEAASLRQEQALGALGAAAQAREERAAKAEERVAALEQAVDAGPALSAPHRTRLDYLDDAWAENVSPNYRKLRGLGRFSKQHDRSSLLLVWSSHVEASGQPGTFCDFQLRIDDRPDGQAEGGGGRAIAYVPSGGAATAQAVAVTTLFERVGAGSHAVSLWVRGTAASCQENYGGFPRSVLVEESGAVR
ncbi:hypothetical protein [Anaeromyxobacter paludicola]|uniref:Uncharacterized protein n=1 Tax=Anaeromyxobacter paludicola TaxID=2918171 RepID=A0ABN6NDE4_9BACT|nr:hypothetical protein [Anaeromyxobacter paludicola]BDG10184.1 hypothetical protein AMPC_32970 [Anaeromyxobacter paludicola]